MFAAVALGAIAAATAGQSLLPKTTHHDATHLADPVNTASAVIGTGGDNQRSLAVQPVAHTVAASAEAQQLAESQHIMGQGGGDAFGAQNANGQTTGATFSKPCDGTVVSTFGGQYGTMHYGIEIRGAQGTSIVAIADGTITAAGPTSGFGQWVKEQLSDGTTLVYARTESYSVHVGQHVSAGDTIAAMGNRGFSNGYSLHLEVWDPNGKKIDPVAWLNTRGVTL